MILFVKIRVERGLTVFFLKMGFSRIQNIQFCNTLPPTLLQLLEVNSGDHFQSTLKFNRHISFDLFRILKLSPLPYLLLPLP